MVVYGGGGNGRDPMARAPNDTWEWDGRQWTMSNATNPGPRRGAAMTYSLRDGIVLSGGTAVDLWKWDGTSWSQLAAAPPMMSPRYAHGMVYDRDRDRIVTFSGAFAVDVWEWDGAAWTRQMQTTPLGIRWNFAMTYDPRRKRTMVTGGTAFSNFAAFEYDGTAWTSIASSTSFGTGCVMVDDPIREALVWMVDPEGVATEVWEWNGVAWDQRQPQPSVPPVYRPAAVFDAVRSEIVLFGGRDGATYLDVTRVIGYQPNIAPEACTSSAIDYDRDGLAGCSDPDCSAICAPLCQGGVCPPGAPSCGDGVCDPLETCLLCPADCPTGCPPDECGDFRCAASEAGSCPGDCG